MTRTSRRTVFLALAAAAGLATLLLATLGWLVVAQCGGLGCDRVTADPAKVRALAEAELGIALPDGVTTIGAREGGFQDRFVQIRLDATDAGLRSLLDALGLARADLIPGGAGDIGPPGGPGWAEAPAEGIETTQFAPPHLAYMNLSIAPAPAPTGGGNHWRVWLFGFDI